VRGGSTVVVIGVDSSTEGKNSVGVPTLGGPFSGGEARGDWQAASPIKKASIMGVTMLFMCFSFRWFRGDVSLNSLPAAYQNLNSLLRLPLSF
jgi:hypothetical protein